MLQYSVIKQQGTRPNKNYNKDNCTVLFNY